MQPSSPPALHVWSNSSNSNNRCFIPSDARGGIHPRAWREPLVYGQPYGGVPCGRFSDRSFFFYFSKFFVVF
jgi:hypothetical protein